MELPEPMRRLAGQEDLKLPLTTFHSVHNEAGQLNKDILDHNSSWIWKIWHLFSWRSEVEFCVRVERGNKIFLVHREAVGGKNFDQGSSHIVCSHPVSLGGINLLVIFHMDK